MLGAKPRLVLRKCSSELPSNGDTSGNPDSHSPRRGCSALPVEGPLLPRVDTQCPCQRRGDTLHALLRVPGKLFRFRFSPVPVVVCTSWCF